jgi:hypothetical protein
MAGSTESNEPRGRPGSVGSNGVAWEYTNSRPWRMVALLALLAPGCRQRTPSASGLRSTHVQPRGASTSAQVTVALNRSATLAPRPASRSRRRGPAGRAAGDAAGSSQGADGDTEQGQANPRKRETKRGSKRGSRRSRSSDDDDDGERSRMVSRVAQVGHVAQQALGRLTGGSADKAAAEASEQVGQAAGEAVQHVSQAADEATGHVGQAAVEAQGKATWTPKKTGKAEQDTRQRRRPAPRRSSAGGTNRGSKRGTRSRSSDNDSD